MVRIRVMTEADVPDVSAIRVRGWRAAYADMVPRSYLDAMDEAQDTADRREMFARSAGRVHQLVAVAEDDEVVGWAAFGPYRGEQDDAETGELYAIYLRTERIGTGVGRALMCEVVRRSDELGRQRLALWVLADNAPARRFYAAAGFAADGAETTDTYDGVPLREVRYVRGLGAAEAR
jgi:L-amino acid N-acyltransferase YncA